MRIFVRVGTGKLHSQSLILSSLSPSLSSLLCSFPGVLTIEEALVMNVVVEHALRFRELASYCTMAPLRDSVDEDEITHQHRLSGTLSGSGEWKQPYCLSLCLSLCRTLSFLLLCPFTLSLSFPSHSYNCSFDLSLHACSSQMSFRSMGK